MEKMDRKLEVGDYEDLPDDVNTAVEKFNALDGWLKNGGFPPKDWKKHG